jgi:5'-3' exonuclease
MKLHLVDATFELFRAFYSRPARRAPDGRPVNAVQGIVDSMLSLLREPDVTHIGAATDHVIESWRNDLYPGYKSSAGVDPDLLAQFDDAERALDALGIPLWAMVEDEADDAIAAAVDRYGTDPRLEQVIICSVDKDLGQLVEGQRIVLRDRMRRITYDEAGIIDKFGVEPASIPDYLALVGDAADGYPGMPGIGPKSAARLIERYGPLEAFPRDGGTIDLDLALLFKRLATLRSDADLFQSVDELQWRGPRPEFSAVAEKIGDPKLLPRVTAIAPSS